MTLDGKISYNDLLRVLTVIVIPIFLWGVSVEKRQAVTDLQIDEMKTEIKDIKQSTKEINAKLDRIIKEIYLINGKLK